MEIKGLYKFHTIVANLILIIDRINWHFLGADGFPKVEINGDEATYFYIKKMRVSGDYIDTSSPPEKHDLSDLIIDPDWIVDYNHPSYSDNSYIIPVSSKKLILAIPFNASNTNKEFKIILLTVEGNNVKSAAIDSDGFIGVNNINFPAIGGKIIENKAFLLCGYNGRIDKGLIVNIDNDTLATIERTLSEALITSNNCLIQLNQNTIASFCRIGDGLKIQIINITEDDNFIVNEPQDVEFPSGVILDSYFVGATKLTDTTCLISYEATIDFTPGPPVNYYYTKRCRVVEIASDNTITLGDEFDFYNPISFGELQSNPDLFRPNLGTFLSATPNGEYVLASYAQTVEQPSSSSEGETTVAILKLLKINGKNINILQSINIETEKQPPSSYGYVIGCLSLSKNSFLYTLVLGENGFFYYIITIENNILKLKKIDKFVDKELDVFDTKTYNNFMFFIASNYDGSWTKDYSSIVFPPLN